MEYPVLRAPGYLGIDTEIGAEKASKALAPMQLGTLQYSSVLGFPIHSTMAASMLRHIELTARAGHDLKDSDWSGKTDP